jgi:surface antigen
MPRIFGAFDRARRFSSISVGVAIGLAIFVAAALAQDKGQFEICPNANAKSVRGFANSAVAGKLSCSEQDQVQDAFFQALENGAVGETKNWQNAVDLTRSGSIKATQWYMDARGNRCRAFEISNQTNNEKESSTGIACRGVDGAWTIVE